MRNYTATQSRLQSFLHECIYRWICLLTHWCPSGEPACGCLTAKHVLQWFQRSALLKWEKKNLYFIPTFLFHPYRVCVCVRERVSSRERVPQWWKAISHVIIKLLQPVVVGWRDPVFPETLSLSCFIPSSLTFKIKAHRVEKASSIHLSSILHSSIHPSIYYWFIHLLSIYPSILLSFIYHRSICHSSIHSPSIYHPTKSPHMNAREPNDSERTWEEPSRLMENLHWCLLVSAGIQWCQLVSF